MMFIDRALLKLDRLIDNARTKRMKSLFRHCGNNVRIEPTCFVIVPENLIVGENTSISSYTTIYATYGVKIGSNCLISSNCGISSYNHVSNSNNRVRDVEEDKNFSKPVTIGNNVWVGMNACILPGVTIGNNAIIGSGSVVTKDVPENEIWAGNPARCLKKLNLIENEHINNYSYV